MNYNENLTEGLCLIAHSPPVLTGNTVTTHYIGPFTMRTMRRILFVLDIGAINSTATINFHIEASNAVGGTWTTIPGTTITAITATPGAAGVVTVEVKAETIAAMTLTGTGVGITATTLPGPWIQGVLIIGSAATPVGVVVLGEGGYYPASDYVGEDTNITTAAFQSNVIQQLVA